MRGEAHVIERHLLGDGVQALAEKLSQLSTKIRALEMDNHRLSEENQTLRHKPSSVHVATQTEVYPSAARCVGPGCGEGDGSQSGSDDIAKRDKSARVDENAIQTVLESISSSQMNCKAVCESQVTALPANKRPKLSTQDNHRVKENLKPNQSLEACRGNSLPETGPRNDSKAVNEESFTRRAMGVLQQSAAASKRGRYDLTVKFLTKIIDHIAAPKHCKVYTDALYGRAVAYCDQKDFRNAVVDAKSLIGIRPADHRAYALIGTIRGMEGNWDEAVSYYKRALDLCVESTHRQRIMRRLQDATQALNKAQLQSVDSAKDSQVDGDEPDAKRSREQMIREQLQSLPKMELVQHLRRNAQTHSKLSRDELIDKIVDCMLHGVLPPCPACNRGHTLRRILKDTLECPRFFDENSGRFVNGCGYRNDINSITRPEWKY